MYEIQILHVDEDVIGQIDQMYAILTPHHAIALAQVTAAIEMGYAAIVQNGVAELRIRVGTPTDELDEGLRQLDLLLMEYQAQELGV